MSEKFLRLAEVQRRVPYSRSTIYAKISRGEFPAPIDLGARAVAWLESDIDGWIEARIAMGRALAPASQEPGKGKVCDVRSRENRAGVKA